MDRMFFGAAAFDKPIGAWKTDQVERMEQMFNGAVAFDQDISEWMTSNVTDMSYMVAGAVKFNREIGGWDTRKVTSMRYMFSNATAFNGDISEWDTSAVRVLESPDSGDESGGMDFMFKDATSFNQDLSRWNVLQIETPPTGFDANAIAWTGISPEGVEWCSKGRPQWGTSGAACLDCGSTDWDAVEQSNESQSAFQCVVDGQVRIRRLPRPD